MASWWGGQQAWYCFHLSYNKTRFLYSCRTHHLEVSHFYYSCCLCLHRPSEQNHHSNHVDSFLFYKCSIGLLGKLRADDSKLEATAGLFDQVINSIFIVKFIWNSYCTVVIDESEEWLSQWNFQSKQLEGRSLKSGLQRDSNPWPPRYRCDARPTEMWRHTLGESSACWVHILPCSEMMWNLYEIHIVLRLWMKVKTDHHSKFSNIYWRNVTIQFALFKWYTNEQAHWSELLQKQM